MSTVTHVEIELEKTGPTHKHPQEFFYRAKVMTEKGREPVIAESRECPTTYEAFLEMARILPQVIS